MGDGYGYESNLSKKFTIHSLILNFSGTLKNSLQARNILAPRKAQIVGKGGKSLKFDVATQWVIAYRESPT